MNSYLNKWNLFYFSLPVATTSLFGLSPPLPFLPLALSFLLLAERAMPAKSKGSPLHYVLNLENERCTRAPCMTLRALPADIVGIAALVGFLNERLRRSTLVKGLHALTNTTHRYKSALHNESNVEYYNSNRSGTEDIHCVYCKKNWDWLWNWVRTVFRWWYAGNNTCSELLALKNLCTLYWGCVFIELHSDYAFLCYSV